MYGLVLEGGGTRGSYEVGAYRALMDSGLDIQGITGTSIGAINGAILAQGDLDLAIEIWKNLSPSTIMDVEDEDFEKIYNLSFDRSEIPQAMGMIKGIIKDGGLDIGPLREKLVHYIDEEKLRNSGRDFGLVSYNLSKKTPVEIFLEDIPQGQLVDYLLASAALPAFKPQEINGETYVDGAIHDNLPFRMLEKKGYEKLILVRIHGMGKIHPYEKSDYLLIEPRQSLGGVMEIDRDKISHNMELGYYDALRALNKYQGINYYISGAWDQDQALDFFYGLADEKIENLRELLGLDRSRQGKKLLFESIIPRLDSLAGLKQPGYWELLVALVESKADQLNLTRFCIYDFKDLLGLAREENRSLSLGQEKKLLATLKDKVFNREDLLKACANIIISY